MTATFFFLVPMMYLSGFIFPIENMPQRDPVGDDRDPAAVLPGDRPRHLPEGRGLRRAVAAVRRDGRLGRGRADAGRDAGCRTKRGCRPPRAHRGAGDVDMPPCASTSGRPATTTPSGGDTSIPTSCRRRTCCLLRRQVSHVEINYTFYRMPTAKTTERLARAGAGRLPLHPQGAQAHHPRSSGSRTAAIRRLLLRDRARVLGPHLGPLLFQLPPNFKCSISTARRVPRRAAADVPAAFEFRHDVVARRRGATSCCGSATWRSASPTSATRRRPFEHRAPRLLPPARRGLRSRRPRAMGRTRSRARRRWDDVFVFFKHEDEGKGPEFAEARSCDCFGARGVTLA